METKDALTFDQLLDQIWDIPGMELDFKKKYFTTLYMIFVMLYDGYDANDVCPYLDKKTNRIGLSFELDREIDGTRVNMGTHLFYVDFIEQMHDDFSCRKLAMGLEKVENNTKEENENA